MWGCEDVDQEMRRCEDVDQQMWRCEDLDQQMWVCEDVLQRLLFYEEPFAGAFGKKPSGPRVSPLPLQTWAAENCRTPLSLWLPVDCHDDGWNQTTETEWTRDGFVFLVVQWHITFPYELWTAIPAQTFKFIQAFVSACDPHMGLSENIMPKTWWFIIVYHHASCILNFQTNPNIISTWLCISH